ncbi:MAG: ATP-binding cassette domain-containing protein [Jatrophihabitans sp.]|uniref:ABC transporter ATP-binding protein n=1 Tax=Jatrophihabitans sp. TaxID=1932789 RepID=UPI003F80FFF0
MSTTGLASPGADTRSTGTVTVLRCESLLRRFGQRVAVDRVGFTIAAGETYGLLGPNGAGKTTIIRLVCGLLRLHGGSIELHDRPLDRAARVHIGYVPQEIALYPELSARENLRFFGSLYHLRGRELAGRVDEVLELIGLRDRADERVDDFSGGMKRRLNIGGGLVHRPDLLVLDEPTVGVDPQSRHAILDDIRTLSRQGLAILYTTHYMEEAERLCDRIGIIDRGRLVAEGTRRELVARVGERDHLELAASGPLDRLADDCRGLPGVHEAAVSGDGLHLVVDDGRRVLPAVLERAERDGVRVGSVQVIEPDLEAAFLHLTGTALRE